MKRRNFFALLLLFIIPKKKVKKGYYSHIRAINISCSLGKKEIFELGRKRPYWKFVNFPVKITEDIVI